MDLAETFGEVALFNSQSKGRAGTIGFEQNGKDDFGGPLRPLRFHMLTAAIYVSS